ncbi:hypothetical protein GBF38_008335, partial [Nibea albiflora]
EHSFPLQNSLNCFSAAFTVISFFNAVKHSDISTVRPRQDKVKMRMISSRVGDLQYYGTVDIDYK